MKMIRLNNISIKQLRISQCKGGLIIMVDINKVYIIKGGKLKCNLCNRLVFVNSHKGNVSLGWDFQQERQSKPMHPCIADVKSKSCELSDS